MASSASPAAPRPGPVRSSRTAQSIVSASVRGRSFVRPSTEDTAIAPKATWDSPSPSREKRRSTSGPPSRAVHSAISTPTARAYRTKG